VEVAAQTEYGNGWSRGLVFSLIPAWWCGILDTSLPSTVSTAQVDKPVFIGDTVSPEMGGG